MHCSGDGGVISTPIGMCMCLAGGGIKTETVPMCVADQKPGATSKLAVADGGGDDGADDSATDASGDGAAGSDDAAGDAADDAGDDGGDDGGQPLASDYGDTLYNAQGADDDCKYDVQWTASPIRQNTDVTFTVTVKRRADNGAPETGGDVTLEIFLTDTHPGNTGNAVSTESPAGSGIYKVGPARFDMPGKWTVRFHFNELCSDEPKDSPHGHVAFFVTVP